MNYLSINEHYVKYYNLILKYAHQNKDTLRGNPNQPTLITTGSRGLKDQSALIRMIVMSFPPCVQLETYCDGLVVLCYLH